MQTLRLHRETARFAPAVAVVVTMATFVGVACGMGSFRLPAILGGLAFVLLLFWDIRVVVPLFLLVIPFGPKYPMSFGNLYLATVIVCITLGVWILRSPFLPRPFTIPYTPVLIALAALFLAMGIAAIRGMYHLLANPMQLMRFIQFFLYSLLFVVVIQMELSRQMIKAFLVIAVIAGVAEGVVGMAQWFSAPGFYLYGTFDGTHNSFALYVTFMLMLLLGVALESRRFLSSAFALAGLVPLAFSALFSFSRGGYVSIAAALPVFFFLPVRKSRKLLLLGASVAVALLAYHAFPSEVRLRAQSILWNVSGNVVGISAASRFEMWEVGFRDFLENPILGKGTWSYGLRDNFYIKVLGEAGILGFTAFILLIYTTLREEGRTLRIAVEDDFMRGICVGLLPATVACLVVYNLTGDFILVHRFMGVFWIVLALVLKYGLSKGASWREAPSA